jgi:hypothetical protein
MPGSAEQVVSEVGKRLAQPRLGKDALVKLLKVTAPRPVPSRPVPARSSSDLDHLASVSRETLCCFWDSEFGWRGAAADCSDIVFVEQRP